MAEYNGRRAPNFAQYLDDLNAIPSPYDQALQQQQRQTTLNLDEELALFTNTEFFDFDKFNDLNLPSFDSVDDKNLGEADQSQNADMKFLDFLQGKFDLQICLYIALLVASMEWNWKDWKIMLDTQPHHTPPHTMPYHPTTSKYAVCTHARPVHTDVFLGPCMHGCRNDHRVADWLGHLLDVCSLHGLGEST